jgi:diguanylate cyclase (GGDEF)-like protein
VSVKPEDYRFYLIMNFAAITGFVLHVAFIFLFLWLDVYYVAGLNILSCSIYLLIFFLNRKGFHDLAAMIGLMEVILHAILAVSVIGWQSGFQYYVLSILPFIYLNVNWLGITKFSVVVLLYITFIGLMYYLRWHAPIVPISQVVLDIVNGVNIAALFLVYSGLAYYYSTITVRVEDRLKQANEKLETLAARDDLTGLLNRREMHSRLEYEISRCRLQGKNFSVVLGDIDQFKSINDRFGHHVGDHVLISLARVMRNTLRKGDQLARWGGEEFLLLLPDTELASGRLVAEKLREHIASTNFSWEGKPIFVTMTFGVSIFSQDCNFDDVLRKADHALIQGKAMGKNCVVVASL